MSSDVCIAPPASETEIGEFAVVAQHAFAVPSEAQARTWLDRAGPEHLRLVRRSGHVVGGLLRIPMAQWFGGQAVPMCGIAGVAMVPEQRGGGLGLTLMRAVLEELRAEGLALSVLYPATQRPYRRVGYAQALCRHRIGLPLDTLAIAATAQGEERTRVELLDAGTQPELVALHERVAARATGWLRRGPYIWSRVLAEGTRAYGCRNPQGTLSGYVCLKQRITDELAHYELAISDVVVESAAAAVALMHFFGGHRPLGKKAIWHGGAADLLLALLDEQTYEVQLTHHAMLRVVHTEAALRQRGYPNRPDEPLQLVVKDSLLTENSGCYALDTNGDGVAVTRTDAARPGRATLSLSIDALAPLYTGLRTAFELRALGVLLGDDAACATAGRWFAGAPPVLPDFF